MGYIYRAYNKISKKSYIGLTTRTIEKRWSEHINYALYDWGCDYNTVLSKAIRKYPLSSWELTSIFKCDKIQGLKQAEQFYILLYHTYILDPECNGYNSTAGGDAVFELNFIPVAMVHILTGKVLAKFDCIAHVRNVVNSKLDRISKDGIAFVKENDNICFVLQSIVDKLDYLELCKFIYDHCPTIVCQLDCDGNLINGYINSRYAGESTHISSGNIGYCCIGQRRMAGGYQWCYIKDLKDRLNKPIKELKLGKPVIQYGMDGIKIKEWPNTETAAKFYKIDGSHITSCCTGHRQTCKKYQWRYASDKIEKLNPLTTKRMIVCVETGMVFETRNHAAKYYNVSFNAITANLKKGKGFIPYTLKYM